jgi:hypothetical protein
MKKSFLFKSILLILLLIFLNSCNETKGISIQKKFDSDFNSLINKK